MQKVDKQWAVLAVILNFLFPGFGTILTSVLAKDDFASKTQIVIGITQFLLSFFMIGWIWAQYWSYLIVKHAFEDTDFVKKYADFKDNVDKV